MKALITLLTLSALVLAATCNQAWLDWFGNQTSSKCIDMKTAMLGYDELVIHTCGMLNVGDENTYRAVQVKYHLICEGNSNGKN